MGNLRRTSSNKSARSRVPRRRGRRQRQKELRMKVALFFSVIIVIVFVSIGMRKLHNTTKQAASVQAQSVQENDEIGKPEIDVKLLSVNPYSRPGVELKKVKDIVIHYTANPNTSAISNRNYFEGLKDSHVTKASSHFIVGIEGEIIQCIPTKEIAYASNERNEDSISIENCHVDDSGKFTQKTYDSLVKLTAWLCKKFDLTSENIIRHYDITKKACPLYYVEHEQEWIDFKADVQAKLEEL